MLIKARDFGRSEGQVGVKVKFTGKACFHHLLFTVLMFFMGLGTYSCSGKVHMKSGIQLFIKDAVSLHFAQH